MFETEIVVNQNIQFSFFLLLHPTRTAPTFIEFENKQKNDFKDTVKQIRNKS